VGHVLKSLGLYSRRVGNAGRGLMLEKSVQLQAHNLGSAYNVLPAEPACCHCQEMQGGDSQRLMQVVKVVTVFRMSSCSAPGMNTMRRSETLVSFRLASSVTLLFFRGQP
jgi:hypothetical protein